MDLFPESGSGSAPSSTYSVEPAQFGVQPWDAPIVLPQSLSPDYYKQKVVEFQQLLNNLALAREATIDIVRNGPVELHEELDALLQELDSKIGRYRQVAELLNLGINGINRIGGNFTKLNIPAGLGIVPQAAVVAAVGGAVAVAAALIVWGYTWIQRSADLARQAQLFGYLTPEQRATVSSRALELDQLAAASESSPLTSIANIAKWVGIAAVAYFAYQAYQKSR
jgi:hypothetical protein